MVLPGDTVLEIGCALGKTTHLLSVFGAGPRGRAIGVDNGARCIRDAQSQHDARRRKALQEFYAEQRSGGGSDDGSSSSAKATDTGDDATAAAQERGGDDGDHRDGDGNNGESGGREGEEEEEEGRCEFADVDAWDTTGLLRLSPFFNSIFVDVGGISGSDGEMEVSFFVAVIVVVELWGRRVI